MNDKSKDDGKDGGTDDVEAEINQTGEPVEASDVDIEDGVWRDVRPDDVEAGAVEEDDLAAHEAEPSASDDATDEAADATSDDDQANEDSSDAAMATAAIVGATAAAGAAAGSSDASAQPSSNYDSGATKEEERKNTPVLAYIWLLILTIGVGYLIYMNMTRGEAVETAAAQAGAAEQAANDAKAAAEGMQASVAAVVAKADANAGQIAALEDVSKLSEAVSAQSAQLTQLETALAEARAALDAVAARPASGTGGASPEALKAAEAAFAEAQAETTAKLDELAGAIAALGDRLTPIEERVAKADSFSLAAAILALDDLRDAIAAGKPFDKLLERAQAALPDNETLAGASWTEFAASGLPTEAGLLTDMQNISIAIGQDRLKDRLNSGESWLDKAVGGVVERLKVRRVGAGVEGDGPAAIAARAEAAMAEGDLQGAIAEAESAEGEGAERFAAWLKGAKALSAARADINDIEEAAIAAADGT